MTATKEQIQHGKFKCEKYAICMYEVSLLFAAHSSNIKNHQNEC